VTVLINEVADGGWGVAGHGYTLSEIPELVQKGARTDPDVPQKQRGSRIAAAPTRCRRRSSSRCASLSNGDLCFD
jgi:hypothetical protein